MKVKSRKIEYRHNARVTQITFDCGCVCDVDNPGRILRGSSCMNCIENMDFGQLKTMMTSSVQAWREELVKAQEEHANKTNAPLFMPMKGFCWECSGDIAIAKGESMRTELITGCPYCCRSYCE